MLNLGPAGTGSSELTSGQSSSAQLNGDDAAGESPMQVPGSDTTADVDDRASGRTSLTVVDAALAALATKSGDVDTDDDKSVEVDDDGADSNYKPSDDDDDHTDIKKKEVYKSEGGAVAVTPIIDLYHSSSSSSSSGEEEAQKDPAAFNELTDIVLSLKDKTYEALLRPYFEQGGDIRSSAARIFDTLRKRLNSTGGSFYRGRNPYLKTTDAFFQKANLYLVKNADEVVIKISNDLVYGRGNYQRKVRNVKRHPSFDESVSEFNKLTDIVLSLKDKTYEALLRPQFQQLWEGRNGKGDDVRSRATAVFDTLRKRLKSTGGNLYRGRNTSLAGDAFFDKANLYLAEDEDKVMKKIKQDLDNGKRYYGRYGKTAQRKGIDAGLRRKARQDVIDDSDYKFLHPTDADAMYQRSIDIVLSVKDQTYYRIVEPYWKAMWEERNDPKSEGATPRAKRAFAALKTKLQRSGGRLYRAHNAQRGVATFWEADNLYRVSDKEAIEKIKADIYFKAQRKSKQSFDIDEKLKPSMLMKQGETSKGKKRGAGPTTKSEESLPSSKRSRPDDGEHAKKWMATHMCTTIMRQPEIRKSLTAKCMRRGCRDEWYLIQPGLSRRDSSALEGVNMFTGEQAILDECFRRGMYQQFAIDTEDGKDALKRAGIVDDPYAVISKSVLDSSRKQEAKVKDAGEEPQNTVTDSRDKSSAEGTPNDLVKLADLYKVVCAKLSEAKSRAEINALNDAFAELGIEFYEALHSLMARNIGSAIDFGKINQSIDFFERIISQYTESDRNANDKIICGVILQQHLRDLETLLD